MDHFLRVTLPARVNSLTLPRTLMTTTSILIAVVSHVKTRSLSFLEASYQEEEESEEIQEIDDHVDSETLELPGVSDEEFGGKGKGNQSLKKDGAQNMRQLFWDFVHDQQKRIKKEFPDMSGKEVLKMAREKNLDSNKVK